MKKFSLLLMFLCCLLLSFESKAQIFTENVGTGTASSIAAYTGWQNKGCPAATYTFTGATADVRTTTASSGYTGASGGANVFFTSTVGTTFTIGGINTLGYTTLVLSMGFSKSTTASNGSEFTVAVSTDGTTFTPLTFPTQATGSGTTAWKLVTISSGIPATGNLRIKFTNTSATPSFRIDDISVTGTAVALTNPAAFDLGSGNYSFTNWSPTSTAGTYPSNMIFHYGSVNKADPLITDITATQDYKSAYNLTCATRINGLTANGFSFVNTNPGNVTPTKGNLGEAVLALNTTARSNVQVSWTAARQTSGGIIYKLRAQYRVGITGAYTDLSNSALTQIEYTSSAGTATNFGPITLPAACENVPVVQIRWVYYYAGTGTGTEDEVRLDEIAVNSSVTAANAIVTGAISGSPFCAGSNVTVPFTYSPTPGFSGATFMAQLSNSTGSFSSPVNLQTVVSNSSGTQSIVATIPAGTATGTGYRIRVVSNTPSVTGSDNGANFSIDNGAPTQPSVITPPAGTPCVGGTYTYSVRSVAGVTYSWNLPSGWAISGSGNGNSVNVIPTSSTGTISVTPANSCGSGTQRTLAVSTVSAGIVVSQAPVAVSGCGDNTVTLSVTASGVGSYQWQYNTGTPANHINGVSGVSGATTNTLTINNPYSNQWSGILQQVVLTPVTAGCPSSTLSATPVINTVPAITLPGTASTIFAETFGSVANTVINGGALPTGWTSTGSDVWTLSGQSVFGTAPDGNVISPGNGTFPNLSYLVSPTINATGYKNLLVTYPARATAGFTGTVILEYSADGGITWAGVPYTNIAYNATWATVNGGVAMKLPANAANIPNLKLRWSTPVQPNSSNYRMDNITVTGVPITTLDATICNSASSFSFPYTSTTGTPDKYSISAGTPAVAGFVPVVDAILSTSPTTIPVNIPANTAAGDYQFKLSVKKSTTGCSSFDQLVIVRIKETPVLSSPLTDNACTGLPYAYTATSTSTGTTFSWSRASVTGITPATGSGSNASISETLVNSTAGALSAVYNITMTANSCPRTTPVTVAVNPLPVASIALAENSGLMNNDGTICSGTSVSLTASPVTGVSYAWSGLPDVTSNVSPSPSSNATYTVTVTDNSTLCSNTASSTVNVTTSPTVMASNTGAYGVGQDIQLNSSSTGTGLTYSWNGPLFTSANQNATITNSDVTNSGAYTITVKDVNRCTATSSTTVNVYSGTTWTGTVSTDWNDPANWTPNVIPNTCGINITILSGSHQPMVSGSSPFTAGDVNIASDVTLTMQGQNLNVCGTWTGGNVNNAVVVGSGTVIINGSSAQTLNGNTQFNILQIQNANGVSISAGTKVSISTGLHLQHGELNTTAGTLELISTATNNSYIDDFTSGFDGTINGNITADRYVPVAGYNQHFISSPVSAPSFGQLGASGPDGSFVTPSANCNERASAVGTAYGSVFQYTDGHSAPGVCMLGNWEIKSAGNLTDGRGYSTYLQGNSTLSLTGDANTGDISTGNILKNSGFSAVQTLQGQFIQSGWNLVGNPYPSSISLTVDRSGDGFGTQVQVWKTTGPFSGSWQSANIGQDVIIIPPFQAFMVLVNTGATGMHSYPFYQSERVRTNATFHRDQDVNALQLTVEGNGMQDVTRVKFNSAATNGYDNKLDANKPDGSAGRPTIYTTMNDNRWYSNNTLPSLEQITVVPMGLRPEANTTMTITADGLESFDPTSYIYLEDKKTNTWQNLRDGAYTFTTKTSDNQDRFALHFTPAVQITTSDASCGGSGMINITQPGTANWNYTLTDNSNSIITSGALNNSAPVSITATEGIYTLTMVDTAGYTIVKNVEVNGSQPVIAAYTPSATNVQAEDNITFTSNTPDAVTYQWDFADGSTASGAISVHNFLSEGIYVVKLTVVSIAGCTSTTTHTIAVTPRIVTGLTDIADNSNIKIWSNENSIYVDFGKQTRVDVRVNIYNVVGKLLSSEKFGGSTRYIKAIQHTEAAYMIVQVINEDRITTKKVFIANVNK